MPDDERAAFERRLRAVERAVDERPHTDESATAVADTLSSRHDESDGSDERTTGSVPDSEPGYGASGDHDTRSTSEGDLGPTVSVRHGYPDEPDDRIDALEADVRELQAAVQAVRGYLGHVRATDETVADRADRAIEKAELALERTATSRERLSETAPERDARAGTDASGHESPTVERAGAVPGSSADPRAGRDDTGGGDHAPIDRARAAVEATPCPDCGGPDERGGESASLLARLRSLL